jgi:Putative MetA-pathway of phenol degradation
LSYSFNDGSVFVDPSLPIEDLKITFRPKRSAITALITCGGRSANITFLFPYVLGNANGTVRGSATEVYRSGLADSRIRFASNLKGGPALAPSEFFSWEGKGLIGVSFTAVVPTGQYDPARVMNGGANRWAFKPEIGLSRRWGRWVLDDYAGAGFSVRITITFWEIAYARSNRLELEKLILPFVRSSGCGLLWMESFGSVAVPL